MVEGGQDMTVPAILMGSLSNSHTHTRSTRPVTFPTNESCKQYQISSSTDLSPRLLHFLFLGKFEAYLISTSSSHPVNGIGAGASSFSSLLANPPSNVLNNV